MKKIIKTLIIIIILTIIALLLFRVFSVQNSILKRIYPLGYSEYVEKYAKEYDIDPFLIYAIIKTESNFKHDVISGSGAIGLMQIMKGTAEEIARNLDIGYIDITEKELCVPDTNINIGVKYFSNLLKKYDNNINLALIAYNAGFGNVDKWVETGVIKEDGSDIENVPFKETNNYVRKILRDYEIYKELY